MLDLSLIKKSYFEMKLPEPCGDILNLLKPTKIMYESLNEMLKVMGSDVTSVEAGIKGLDELYKFTTRVINRNKENKVYKQKLIEELIDVELAEAFLELYLGWAKGISNTPN